MGALSNTNIAATGPAASSASSLMGASYAVSALASISGAFAQGQAIKNQAAFSQSVAEENAKLAELSAADAVRRGDVNANVAMTKGRAVVGSQRAALAAQGVDVNSGSAMDVQASTQKMSALDAMTIRNNAAREALGYKIQALDYTTKAQFTKTAAQFEEGSTYLTGGLKAVQGGMEAGYWFGK